MNEQFLSKAKTYKNEWTTGHYYIGIGRDINISKHTTAPTKAHFIQILNSNKKDQIKLHTLCQCTGIRDKDKKLAFNGDLFWDEDMYMKIIWTEGEFLVIWNDGPQPVEDWIKLTSNYMIDKVIVGNIHDDKCMVI